MDNPTASTAPLAARRFTEADQAAFARLSGDVNPMHMDRLAARRTQAGEPVVHGIHALLWALDAAAASGLPVAGVRHIRAQFSSFTLLGRAVTLRVARQDGAGMRLALSADGVQTMTLLLLQGDRPSSPPADLCRATPATLAPAAPPLEDMAACTGRLLPPVDDADFARAFPHAANALTARRLSGLAQASRLVGMVCPGLHSIFAGLALDLTNGADQDRGVSFQVTRADARFRLVDMAVQGSGLAGKLSAFVRQPPVDAPTTADIARHVQPGEFAGITALIAGGSRGLGAVTAKIIAAGGGQVAITYASGQQDAEAVRQDICSVRGAPACRVLPYDAGLPAAPQLAAVAGWANQLYYFATKLIFTAKPDLFSAAQFAQFTQIYVAAFHECCQAMARQDLVVFYPSSVFVEARPAGMLEYSMAKMAGEMLCAELRAQAGLRILVSRLPRVLTDQTATVTRADTADPLDTMLPLVRAMQQAVLF